MKDGDLDLALKHLLKKDLTLYIKDLKDKKAVNNL